MKHSGSRIPGERIETAISDTLVFRLIVAMNLIVKPFIEVYARRFGISLSEWRCLLWLAADPGASGEDVARATGMDRMTVSRTLRRLKRDGRASRIPDSTNRKRFEWRLTAAGWALYDEISPSAMERDRRITRTIPEAERVVLTDALDRIIADLRKS
jgi:DNA-binding MarR family transcriptional regulator